MNLDAMSLTDIRTALEFAREVQQNLEMSITLDECKIGPRHPLTLEEREDLYVRAKKARENSNKIKRLLEHRISILADSIADF